MHTPAPTMGRPKSGTVVESHPRASWSSHELARLVNPKPSCGGGPSLQETLFHRIPLIDNTQACWCFLLMCASTRANFKLRAVRPEQSRLQSVTTPTCRGVSEPLWDQSQFRTAARLSPNCHSLWVDFCSEVENGSTLVQLGKMHPHDQTTSPLITSIHRGPAVFRSSEDVG